MRLKRNQVWAIILIAVVSISVFTVAKRMLPLTISLPDGHRAYEWEWIVEARGPRPETQNVQNELHDQIMEKLSVELDEQSNSVQIIDEPKVTVEKIYDCSGTKYVEKCTYRFKGITTFHGHFTEGSISLAVLAIIYKLAPLIISGIIVIMVLDRIQTITNTIRDITTDYVVEEVYDEEGNLVSTRRYRKSLVSEWIPWVFAIIATIGVVAMVWRLVPLFGVRHRQVGG